MYINSDLKSPEHIHALAFVNKAKIGLNTKVYQFASVILGATIGDNTIIGPNAMINGSHIGNDTLVSYGVNMGPGFKVGNNVFLGPEVVLCNDLWPRVDKAYFDVGRFTRDGEWAVIIEDFASLGARATVLPGVRIGRNAMVAAHAVVNKDVPDNHIFYANGHIEEIHNEETRLMRRMRFVRDQSQPSPAMMTQAGDMIGQGDE
jgi:UDP-2-acetamido-3-amino-2,3-dideoxy-glucuronate N-acetyltransferase